MAELVCVREKLELLVALTIKAHLNYYGHDRHVHFDHHDHD